MFASATRGLPPRPSGLLLAGSTLSVLKPWLRSGVRPLANMLVAAGVTANQVTVVSLAGSLVTACVVTWGIPDRKVFLLLALWLGARTILAALDGTMAVEFGQKTRLGGVLNEVGDLVSDVVLIAPFGAVAPLNPRLIMLVVALSAALEGVGLNGPHSGAGGGSGTTELGCRRFAFPGRDGEITGPSSIRVGRRP